MYTIDEVPFVNEECGDTMWNEESLNPPKHMNEKLRPSVPLVLKNGAQDVSLVKKSKNGKNQVSK